ncbi:MAG: hypothetical protein IIB64_03895 [Proteobacteria bacterium]|nr:hypothetical protein [Pseudomonadota bacterium]
MTFAQALIAMDEGKAIRRPSWAKERHWFKRGSTIVSSGGDTKEVTEVTIVNTMAVDWEIYPDSPVVGYDQTKTMWVLRCVTRTEDAVSLHVSKDSVLAALAEWCRIAA